MSIRNLVVYGLLISVSSNAFAVCDQERREYEEWRDRHDALEAAANVAQVGGGIIGAFFAVPTFGFSLAFGGLAGAAPGLAAQNAARIRDEKLSNLRRCEEAVAHEAEKAAQEARRLEAEETQRQLNRQQARARIIEAFDQERTQAELDFQQDLVVMLEGLVNQGADIESLEAQDLINQTTRDLQAELQIRLSTIEENRQLSLDSI